MLKSQYPCAVLFVSEKFNAAMQLCMTHNCSHIHATQPKFYL